MCVCVCVCVHAHTHMCTCARVYLVAQSCLTLFDPMDYPRAPLSIEYSRQENWKWLPFPTPGDHPDLVIEPMTPAL